MAVGFILATVLFVLFLALSIVTMFSRKNHLPVEGRTVLITGASQGLGKSVAVQLSAKGANLIIVARDVEKLAAALKEIHAAAKHPNQRFHYISADVTSATENQRVITEAIAWNNGYPPEIVWQIAGASKPTLFLESSLDTMRGQMDLNYWASIYLVRATIEAWMKPTSSPPSTTEPPPRHIVLTSSMAALLGVAGYSPYCPAKAAMRSFCDSLRNELCFYNGSRRQPATLRDPTNPPPPTDMFIHTVFPPTIDSPGLQLENEIKHDITLMLEEVDPVMHPDVVARRSISGLEAGEYFVMPSWWSRFMGGASWQGSPRSSIFADTIISWIVNLVWLFVMPDLDRQVWKYGVKWGLKGKPKEHKKWY